MYLNRSRTWSQTKLTIQPTSDGTVSLVLLRGPSTNVVPMYAIAEAIPNTGSYTWTPAATLEDDVSHYGIQLIQDATGYYQYTDQFGVSNKAVASSSTPEAAPASTAAPEETEVITPEYTTSAPAAAEPTYEAEPTEAEVEEESISYSTHYATLTSCDCTETPTSYAVVPTGTGSQEAVNSTGYNVPSSTTPPTAEYTGAGSQLKVGGALVAVVAAMGMCLLI